MKTTMKCFTKLPLMLLLSTSLPAVLFAHAPEVAHDRSGSHLAPKRVSFAGTIIGKMDGVPGILDAEAISDCFTTVQKIIQLINGVLDHTTGQHVGLFVFEGIHYTLKELVMIEARLIKNNVPLDDPEYVNLRRALKALKDIFQREAAPLLEKTKKPAVRSMNLKLVSLWVERSSRTNSMLKDFGTEQELIGIERASAREFFFFLNDLKCFLKDLMHSAPRASEMYKKECLKPENYQAFDNFLNN